MKDNFTNVVLLRLTILRVQGRKSEYHEYRSQNVSCEIAQLIVIPIITGYIVSSVIERNNVALLYLLYYSLQQICAHG